jgi:uncharacterized protein YdeI (YjbR/CyaY-like superfamily)
MPPVGDSAAVFFAEPGQWRAWLAEHHDTETEVWVGFYKRHTGRRGMTWAELVDEALCYGWIDGLVRRIDDDTYKQRLTPRGRRSTWSTVNLRRVPELVALGRMTPAGLAAYERRTADRQGIYAYESEPGELPPEYADQLAAVPAARAFFEAQRPSYRRVAVSWVLSGKQQATRDRRMAQLVQDCADGVLIKSQRYGVQARSSAIELPPSTTTD